MKKISLFIFVILFLSTGSVVFAQTDEAVRDFSVTIRINEDASLSVEESISYDFGESEHHGIYRDLPYRYKARKGNFNLRYGEFSVRDGTGRPLEFTWRKQGDDVVLKIGHPEKTVSGNQIYVISYRVKRAVSFFAGQDELYWNATGHGWTVPIEQSKATVILPTSVKDRELAAACFAGAYGSEANCLSTRYEYATADTVSAVIFAQDRLKPAAGLTFAVAWPAGLIAKPSLVERFMETAKDNWIIVLPFFTLGLFVLLWRMRGRDPKGRGTVIARYEPLPGLSPAEIGTILDERVHKRDLSAELIQLAVRGYLRIRRLEKKGLMAGADYELEKLKDNSGLEREHERLLFKTLFLDQGESVRLSALKNRFYREIPALKRLIYAATAAGGYFPVKPNTVRAAYAGAGAALIVAGLFGFSLYGLTGIISLGVAGAIIIVFSFFMPRRTAKGALAREHILGFKEYLRVAEKDRLEFHNAPAKNPDLFERFLPYAIALGVEKEWAGQFSGIYRGAPDWYLDPAGRTFTAMAVADTLKNFQTAFNAAAAPPAAASGGSGLGGSGFSGGGFGGGGGRSW